MAGWLADVSTGGCGVWGEHEAVKRGGVGTRETDGEKEGGDGGGGG